LEQFWLILIGVLLVCAIVAGAILAYKAEQKRLAALHAFAASQGWSFEPRRDSAHDDRYTHFAVFSRGEARYAFNTMSGPLSIGGREFQARMGDYRYQVTRSDGKTTTTSVYTFSYLILHLPFRSVPEIHVRREGLLDKLAGAMGFDDIDFESSEFSRKFHVKSTDKRFAYDLITPDMMEYILAALPGIVEIEHGRFLITDGASRWEPSQYPTMLAWAVGFFDRWPRHLVHSLESHGGTPT
jgi:hypothetical protein